MRLSGLLFYNFSAYEDFQTICSSSVIILILMIFSTSSSLALLREKIHKAIRIWAACSSFLTSIFMFWAVVVDFLSLMYYYTRLDTDLKFQAYIILCLCFLAWPIIFLFQIGSLWYSFAALQVFRSTSSQKTQRNQS